MAESPYAHCATVSNVGCMRGIPGAVCERMNSICRTYEWACEFLAANTLV